MPSGWAAMLVASVVALVVALAFLFPFSGDATGTVGRRSTLPHGAADTTGHNVHDAVARARERCELDVIDGAELEPSDFLNSVVDQGRPVLVVNTNVSRWPAAERWTPWDALLSSPVADLEFRVGQGVCGASLPLGFHHCTIFLVGAMKRVIHRKVPGAATCTPTLVVDIFVYLHLDVNDADIQLH